MSVPWNLELLPIYPLDASEIEDFGNGRPYPREAFHWFASKLNQKIETTVKPLPPKARFEQAYANALSQFDANDLNDNHQVADVLRFGFQKILDIEKLQSEPIEGVFLHSIADITPKAKNDGRLNFKIMGKEEQEEVVIGVSVLQNTHGLSVGAGFRRLLDTETFGLSRGCLVRSKDLKIKRNWDSYEYYKQLISAGGEWVDLKAPEFKPLLALKYVYDHHEKFSLTVKRLDTFAFTRNLLINNPLIKEILSRPEGQVSEDALEGESIIRTNINPESVETDLAQALAIDNDVEIDDCITTDFKEFADSLAS